MADVLAWALFGLLCVAPALLVWVLWPRRHEDDDRW